MLITLLVAVAFAVAFYRAAAYEGMSTATWSLGSFALAFAVAGLGGGILLIILAQVGLFGAMTWHNATRARK